MASQLAVDATKFVIRYFEFGAVAWAILYDE